MSETRKTTEKAPENPVETTEETTGSRELEQDAPVIGVLAR